MSRAERLSEPSKEDLTPRDHALNQMWGEGMARTEALHRMAKLLIREAEPAEGNLEAVHAEVSTDTLAELKREIAGLTALIKRIEAEAGIVDAEVVKKAE